MDRISRYIFGQLSVATIVVTLTVTCAVWLTQSLRFIELIVNRGLSVGSYIYLTILLLPSFLAVLLPIGFFAAMLFTYNRLTSDSELIVMRAVGLGPGRLAKPALILATLAVVIGYLLTLVAMPLSYRQFKNMESDTRSDYSAILLKEGAFNNVRDGVTVYIRSREANDELRGILIQDNRDPSKAVTIMAERGVLAQASDGPRIILLNGNRQVFERDTQKFSLLYFERYSAELGQAGSGGEGPGVRWREPRERFVGDLLFPGDSPMDRANHNRLIVEGHSRLTSSLYALAFALVALAALLPGDYNRRGQGQRIVAAIFIAIVLQSLSVFWNGIAARYPALIPVIYANVLLPIAGCLWWLFRVPRRRSRPAEMATATG